MRKFQQLFIIAFLFCFAGCKYKSEDKVVLKTTFTPLLLNEVIPYTENHFRVLIDRDYRVMTGLSWDLFQTFSIALTNLDEFLHIGGFSGAGMFSPTTEFQTVYNGAFADSEKFNTEVHAFFLGIGIVEGKYLEDLSNALKKAGVNNTYYESQGTAHEWLTWRRCFNVV